jgi:hypothetical protein
MSQRLGSAPAVSRSPPEQREDLPSNSVQRRSIPGTARTTASLYPKQLESYRRNSLNDVEGGSGSLLSALSLRGLTPTRS